MKATEKLCAVCSEPITDPPTGRPRRYCGEGCRRAAEAERARLGRFVSWLERELVKAKCDAAGAYGYGSDYARAGAAARVTVLTEELAEARDRYVAP